MILDARGSRFDFSQRPRRVVSLVPSLTETLFDLGAGGDVVGITDFCIFPENLDRPRVGGTKNPRVELIRTLEPDLVHMNLEENLRRHAEAIEEFAPVFVSEPKTVADVSRLIETLGLLHHQPEAARQHVERLRAESTRGERRPFLFACAIWKKPWMWCGGDTYVSDLVETAGGRNVLRDRLRYPELDVDEVAQLDPEIVFLPDEPFVFTEDDAAALGSRFRGKVIGPFPGHLFTWHGTRTIRGLQFLREVAFGVPR